MPTEPITQLWPSKENADTAAPFLNQWADSIREVTAFGTHVLGWCGEATSSRIEHYPVAPLFRHALELLDALQVLVRNSCGYPAFGLCRQLLETDFSIRYILKEDTRRRSLAYRLKEIHREISLDKTGIEGSPEAKQFLAKKKKDLFMKNHADDLVTDPGLSDRIELLEAHLSSKTFADVETEYKRLRETSHSNPEWYSLFGGPKSLVELADRVELPYMYDLAYRRWSGVVHATDVRSGRVFRAEDGTAMFTQLRDPSPVLEVASFAISFSLDMIRLMVSNFCPQKNAELKRWYEEEIRTILMQVAGTPVFNVTFNDGNASGDGKARSQEGNKSTRRPSRGVRRRQQFGKR